MANTSPKLQDRSFTLRVDEQFMREIDELRSMLSPIPSKSDAVRFAVRQAVRQLARQDRNSPVEN